MSSYYPNRFIE